MALQLNTSDPLYNNITACIVVDSDDTIKDLTGNLTLTVDPAVTVGSGTAGKYFTTSNSDNDALGIATTPDLTNQDGAYTVLIITDGILSSASRRSMLNGLLSVSGTVSPAVLASGNASYTVSGGAPSFDSGVNITSGLHSLGLGGTESPRSYSYNVDGTEVDGDDSNRLGFNEIGGANYIGGNETGGYGYCRANYVYVTAFDVELQPADYLRLHNSLGANNTFALIEEAPATPVTFDGNIDDQNPEVTSEFRLDISSEFSGTATPLSYSITPPITGVSIEGSEVVIAQPTTGTLPDNISNIVVRATDQNTDIADSNPFNVTWDTSPWGVKRSEIEAADTSGGNVPPFLLSDFDVNDLPDDRFSFIITSYPADGNLELSPNSTGVFYGAADGSYTATYDGYKNGQFYGEGTLNLVVGVTNTNLTIDSGMYFSLGADLTFKTNRLSFLDSGDYSLIGSNLELQKNSIVSAQEGVYTLNGSPITLFYGQLNDISLSLDSGTYSYSGAEINLSKGFLLETESGNYTTLGSSITLGMELSIRAETGSYDSQGTGISLIYSGENYYVIESISIAYSNITQ